MMNFSGYRDEDYPRSHRGLIEVEGPYTRPPQAPNGWAVLGIYLLAALLIGSACWLLYQAGAAR